MQAVFQGGVQDKDDQNGIIKLMNIKTFTTRLSCILIMVGWMPFHAFTSAAQEPERPAGMVPEIPAEERWEVEKEEAPAGMIPALTGFNVNDLGFMKALRIQTGAWLDQGVNWNPQNPSDRFNGPVTFDDRTNNYQLNQFNLFLERATNKEGDAYDLGFRGEVILGTDARFTQATGLDVSLGEVSDYYGVAAPQLYIEGFAPWGRGLTLKGGHFYTLIGYEVVPASGNFFYSHAYTMQYGEPFTHTGALLTYPLTANLTITGGAVNGWDNWDVNPGRFSGIGALNWVSADENTSLALSGISGPDKVSDDNLAVYSVVLVHKFLEKFTGVLQHDNGFLENGAADGGTARWYGVNSYLFYDVTDKLATGLRFEWFRDADGVRVVGIGFDGRANNCCPGVAANYYELTAGVNWNPLAWLRIRPEVRFDFSTTPVFDDASQRNQVLFAIDAVVTF